MIEVVGARRQLFYLDFVRQSFFRSLVLLLIASPLVVSGLLVRGAHAHIENGTLTDTFRINSVKIVSKGPYIPGDIISFGVVSDLPLTEREWIQVTADCLAYPAEWHQGTGKNFVSDKFIKKAQATAVISSGCVSGVHVVTEVLLSDSSNNYTRVTSEDFDLPSFEVSKGHLRPEAPEIQLKKDSLKSIKIPPQIKLKSNLGQTVIMNLPRTTDGGQTLDWVATGDCAIRRFTGVSDLGGVLLATNQGNCVLSSNTPWGSNLYKPLNQAAAIEVFPPTAISCQPKSKKGVKLVAGSTCPKGYKRTK
jgi:hypothetical protein